MEAGTGKTKVAQSHPTWVRGLKSDGAEAVQALVGRTPRGCVD